MSEREQLIKNMMKAYAPALSSNEASSFRDILNQHKGSLSHFNNMYGKDYESERVIGKKGKAHENLRRKVQELISKNKSQASNVKPSVPAPKAVQQPTAAPKVVKPAPVNTTTVKPVAPKSSPINPKVAATLRRAPGPIPSPVAPPAPTASAGGFRSLLGSAKGLLKQAPRFAGNLLRYGSNVTGLYQLTKGDVKGALTTFLPMNPKKALIAGALVLGEGAFRGVKGGELSENRTPEQLKKLEKQVEREQANNKRQSEANGDPLIEKESPNSPDTEILSTSDNPPASAPTPRKATTMQDVDNLYKKLGLGSYSGRTDYTQADPNASVQLPQSDTSFYLPEEKKADYKFTDKTSIKTGLKLETEEPFPEFNPEAAKNLPDLFGLTPEMSGQSGLSKGIVTATPVVSNGLNLDAGQRAFLYADGKGKGIRARDRALGLLYASGNYYTENPNRGQDGEKDWSLLKDEEARQVINGEAGAQELLKKRLAALQGETPANAAEIQAPVDVSQIVSEVEKNAYPIQQGEPKLTGNKLEDAFNSGYERDVPRDIKMYKDFNRDFNVLSKEDRERIFNRPGIYGR